MVVINFAGLAAIVVINIAATAGVHAAKPGLAAGILRTCQQVGAAFGVALPSVVATARAWAPIPAALLAHRAV